MTCTGAIVVLLIIAHALQLDPQDIAVLISAGLVVCGIITIIQHHAAIRPMTAIAGSGPGTRVLFRAITAAAAFSTVFAPQAGRIRRRFRSVAAAQATKACEK